MEDDYNIEFKKLNLAQDDILILKVDTSGMDEEQAIKKVSGIREDSFVKYIEDQGNKVIVSYTGIDFQILRKKDNDIIVAYIDVSSLEEEESEKYVNYVNFKLREVLDDKLKCIPVKNGSPILRVESGEENV